MNYLDNSTKMLDSRNKITKFCWSPFGIIFSEMLVYYSWNISPTSDIGMRKPFKKKFEIFNVIAHEK